MSTERLREKHNGEGDIKITIRLSTLSSKVFIKTKF